METIKERQVKMKENDKSKFVKCFSVPFDFVR